MIEERILWDNLCGTINRPIYQSNNDNPCKVRYHNGRDNIWIDYFPYCGRVHSSWITKVYCVTEANIEINKCLEDSKYLIVSFKENDYVCGTLEKTESSLVKLLSLSIIGLDNLYLGDGYIEAPSWFVPGLYLGKKD